MHTSLTCASCDADHDPTRPQNLCTACGKPLLVGYDLDAIRGSFTPDVPRARAVRSMWRFSEVLPVDDPADAISLGEGDTPLLRLSPRGPFERFRNLWVKDEALNPTASFKSRGMSAAITRAAALGVRSVALPSAGNAAGAAAAYAARAGMECVIFMPVDTPRANIIESVVSGARVYLVNGLITDCGKLVREGMDQFGWFDLSTLKEPFRIEGKKTMGYELALDLAGQPARTEIGSTSSGDGRLRLPDVILYPTGGGTGLIGMWKAFEEMEALGWIGSERPRMVVVQAKGCCPIVRAFEAKADHAKPFPDARTKASGLRVPAAIGDFLMLRALRESGGTAVAVSDRALMDGAEELARMQGIFACPEGGAVWTAARKLADDGWIDPEETVVLFNTGSGLKYGDLYESLDVPVIDHRKPDWHRAVSSRRDG